MVRDSGHLMSWLVLVEVLRRMIWEYRSMLREQKVVEGDVVMLWMMLLDLWFMIGSMLRLKIFGKLECGGVVSSVSKWFWLRVEKWSREELLWDQLAS